MTGSKSIISNDSNEESSESEMNFLFLKQFYSENDMGVEKSYKLNEKFIGGENE